MKVKNIIKEVITNKIINKEILDIEALYSKSQSKEYYIEYNKN